MGTIGEAEYRRIARRKPVWAAAGLLVAAAALAGCSGGRSSSASDSGLSGSASASAAAGQESSGGGAGTKIVFIAGAGNDPFFSTMKRGADDAARALAANGGSLDWLTVPDYSNFGPDLAKLLQTAESMHPAAVASIAPEPAAEDPLLEQIAAGGTPVIIVNSGGLAEANKVGALSYVGSDDGLAGVTLGKYLVQQGVKNVLCVNTLPGTSISAARCGGIKSGEAAGGGTSSQLALPPTNFGSPTAVAQAIKAALLKDSSIDGVVTIDQGDADSAASALQQAGLVAKVKLGSFDLDSTELARIKAGTQMVAVDQQPYMQGYLAVSLAYQYAEFGLNLPATEKALLTGPALVTKDNVSQAIAGAAAGAR